MEIFKRKDLPWRLIDDEALVVNPQNSLVYPLNPVAARAWQLLDGLTPIETVIKKIYDEFEIDRTTLESDIKEFIQQLKEEGLIEKI